MILNYGPKGVINYNRKIDPLNDLSIKFEGEDSDYQSLNLTGIENKYKLYKEGKKWCLFIYSSCNINFLKEAKGIDVGLVGGGGGGGENRNAKNATTSAGGGGGAGGQRVTKYSQTFLSQIYQITIGTGGTFKNNGNKTSIISIGNPIFEAEGGLAGAAPIATLDTEEHGYEETNYANGGIGGNGGSKENAIKTYNNSSYGGNGSAGSGTATQGEDGQSLFNSSILSNQEDLIIVGAGGGGGHGHYQVGQEGADNYQYTEGQAANHGNSTIYGRGGNGKKHLKPNNLENVSVAGGNGLVILRG